MPEQLRMRERQLYGTGKQSRSFANATGPEKFLLISDRLCSSLHKSGASGETTRVSRLAWRNVRYKGQYGYRTEDTGIMERPAQRNGSDGVAGAC
jgi:hypothetical protein